MRNRFRKALRMPTCRLGHRSIIEGQKERVHNALEELACAPEERDGQMMTNGLVQLWVPESANCSL